MVVLVVVNPETDVDVNIDDRDNDMMGFVEDVINATELVLAHDEDMIVGERIVAERNDEPEDVAPESISGLASVLGKFVRFEVDNTYSHIRYIVNPEIRVIWANFSIVRDNKGVLAITQNR